MANAVEAGWHGHDYQARFFWIKASALRDDDQTHVVEVSYEADGPKAFDDVIVHYHPPRNSSTCPNRIPVDYYQIKFHVCIGGRFGFADLIDPAFIGATTVSVLERLKQAKQTAPPNAAFTLVTTDGVKDGDPLGMIISSVDHSLRLDRLFVGGDRSKMGKVRKLWRDHLKLTSDAELQDVLDGLHIAANSPSLEQLRETVNLRFRSVGLITCSSTVEFRFDAAARALKTKGLNRFNRKDFDDLCREEGWHRTDPQEEFRNVSLRSFSDGPNDKLDAHPDYSLSLLSHFGERHLQPGVDWTSNIQPIVENFLERIRGGQERIRLFLDVHTSIAFLAGTGLGLKSGLFVEIIQKGRSGPTVWRSDEGTSGPGCMAEVNTIGTGEDVALVVSLSHNAIADVHDYLTKSLPEVGRIIHITPQAGPGQRTVASGAHAASLADEVAKAVKDARIPITASLHIFVTGPNAFTFFLGQHRQAMGRCVLYEYDFNRRVDGSYHPTFRIGVI